MFIRQAVKIVEQYVDLVSSEENVVYRYCDLPCNIEELTKAYKVYFAYLLVSGKMDEKIYNSHCVLILNLNKFVDVVTYEAVKDSMNNSNEEELIKQMRVVLSEKYKDFIDDIFVFVSKTAKFLKTCDTYENYYKYVCKHVNIEYFEDYNLTV